MKHFRWKMFKKIEQFNNNTIVRHIKQSFIYNLIIALVLIMLMILLLFQVKPQKAYIYAELEQIDIGSLNYQGKVLQVEDISHNYTSISSMNKIKIDLEGLTINNTDYSKGVYLEIYPSNSPSVFVDFLGKIDQAYFYDVTSNVNQYGILYSKDAAYCFVGEQHFNINYGTAYIYDSQSGERKELDCTEEIVLMNTSHKDIIDEYRKLIDNITEKDGSIRIGSEEQYLNYTHIIERFSDEETYTMEVFAEPIDTEQSNTYLTTCFNDCKVIKSEHISSCEIVANGQLTVSYTPTAEEYDLKKQEIYLFSEDSSLNLNYDIENDMVSIYGYVDSATLSLMNLFPDFWNWYFTNIYMAPLTLVSTVFAAVSMMNAAKKKK